MIRVDKFDVPKSEVDWDEYNIKIVKLNAKVMNMLYCSLDINEFNVISSCILVKQVWDKLQVIYVEANQKEESSSKENKKELPNLCLLAYEDEKKKKKKK